MSRRGNGIGVPHCLSLLDTRGISAVEFALIFPLMLIIYVGVLYAADISMARNKVFRAAQGLAMTAAAGPAMSDPRLAALMAATLAVLDPLDGEPQIVLSGVATSDTGPVVAWSGAVHASAPPAGAPFHFEPDAPAAFDGGVILVADISLTYNSRFARAWNALPFVSGLLRGDTALQARVYAFPAAASGTGPNRAAIQP